MEEYFLLHKCLGNPSKNMNFNFILQDFLIPNRLSKK